VTSHQSSPILERESSHGNKALIDAFCNDACTLPWGARRARRRVAAFSAALLSCAAALETSAAVATPSTASCAGANLRPSAADAPAVEAATLCLINRARAAHRLPALRSNRELGTVAAGQVASMVRWNYFADVGPAGQTPLSLVVVTRYPAHAAGIAVGQNIAWGTGNDTTPAHIVAAWMASPPHREIILSAEFRDAAAAVKPSVPGVLDVGHKGATYAMEFGVRRFQAG
jgi:uncharacterized protein YkwD